MAVASVYIKNSIKKIEKQTNSLKILIVSKNHITFVV